MPSLPDIFQITQDLADESTDGHNTDDSLDTPSDVSSDLVEILPDELPLYFRIAYSRRFHSHGDLPYPLPSDPLEYEVSVFLIFY